MPNRHHQRLTSWSRSPGGEIKVIQSLSTRKDGWVPPVVRAVASDGLGIAETLAAARSCVARADPERAHRGKLEFAVARNVAERLLGRFPDRDFESAAQKIAERRADAYTIIDSWLKR